MPTSLINPFPSPERKPFHLAALGRSGTTPLRFRGICLSRYQSDEAGATLEVSLWQREAGGLVVRVVVDDPPHRDARAWVVDEIEAAMEVLERFDPVPSPNCRRRWTSASTAADLAKRACQAHLVRRCWEGLCGEALAEWAAATSR